LQLYQEGLFQESGTGDLKMAAAIYLRILKEYTDYRDLSAVALYHLGLINEKAGDPEKARQYYQRVFASYADQQKIHAQAGQKLNHLAAGGQTTPQAKGPPAEVPPPFAAAVPSASPYTPARQPPRFGVGLNVLGMHVRYRTDKNLQLEVLAHVRENAFLIGARSAFYADAFSASWPLSFYGGMGCDWFLTPAHETKYKVGGFLGGEWALAAHLGAGIDFGYYYINQKQDNRLNISTKVGSNAYVTLYF
ncbi:tetratricopeptide repeat protein, partial [candidate division FCPU426 bacterium]|nr:tetratricopeptide repeat protein [candidate division FCPU426 bacterium]